MDFQMLRKARRLMPKLENSYLTNERDVTRARIARDNALAKGAGYMTLAGTGVVFHSHIIEALQEVGFKSTATFDTYAAVCFSAAFGLVEFADAAISERNRFHSRRVSAAIAQTGLVVSEAGELPVQEWISDEMSIPRDAQDIELQSELERLDNEDH